MKIFIKKRWIVEGFYCYCKQTSLWKFQSKYREGEVVWEFGDHTLACSVDGKTDHTVPYTVVNGDILVIDFSSLIPHFNRYIETYKIMKRGGEVWLYDRKIVAPGKFWLAIKLLPAE
jgi:hypothetical protein